MTASCFKCTVIYQEPISLRLTRLELEGEERCVDESKGKGFNPTLFMVLMVWCHGITITSSSSSVDVR
jgi:hypothetical protein